MWKDIERISGVPFSRSAPNATGGSSSLEINYDAKSNSNERRAESLRIALDKENEINSTIQIELNKTKAALLDMTSRANESDQMIKVLQTTVDKLGTQNEAYRHDLLQMTATAAEKDATIEGLCDKVKELESQVSNLSNSNNNLANQHSQARNSLELSKQQNLEQQSEIERLELCLSVETAQHRKDKEAAELELKQAIMILQTKLDHTHEQLKESESREKEARKARTEAMDEIPILMAKFKSERDTIRDEMTKLHEAEVEKYKSHMKRASTQLKEMDSRLAKQAGDCKTQLHHMEEDLNQTKRELQAACKELDDKRNECKRLKNEVVEQLNEDVKSITDKLHKLQKEKTDEAQASRVLVERLQRQVEETKEFLDNERSGNAAALNRLENSIIAMVRDNFSSSSRTNVSNDE